MIADLRQIALAGDWAQTTNPFGRRVGSVKMQTPRLGNLFDPIFLPSSAWAQGTGVEPL